MSRTRTRSKAAASQKLEKPAVDVVNAVIQLKLGSDESYKEIAELSSLSKSGCSFEMQRSCAAGQLVSMVVPMPKDFRAYDLDEELYPVIALVQNCYEVKGPDGSRYRVGVAFVGKNFPPSYDADPLQTYHISGTSDEGMWKIAESGKAFKVRNAPRFWIEHRVTITWIRKEHRTTDKENTITVNVSATGALVVSKLKVKVGDKVKFASKDHDFYTIAIVRNKRDRDGLNPVLHLEFVERRFPVERLPVPQVTEVTNEDRDRLIAASKSEPVHLLSA